MKDRENVVALKRAVVRYVKLAGASLLGAGVLGDGLGALADSVFGQLSREKQTHGSLDFSAGDGGSPVVVGQTAGLSSNPLKDVVNKAVHDGHGLAGNASVRVNLLQDLVHVDGIAFLPPPLALLVPRTGCFSLGGCLLGSLCAWFGRHVSHTNAEPICVHPTPTNYLYQDHMQIGLGAAHPERGCTSRIRLSCAAPSPLPSYK